MSLTRRSLLCGGASFLAKAQELKPVASAVDHVLLGVSDLDHGIDWVEKRTGVRAAVGGVHPGAGTRNALLSLGPGHYLEIIAPDPAQSGVKDDRHLRELSNPRLITFAITTQDVDAVAAKAHKARLTLIGPHDGSRRLPSGKMLRWRTLAIQNDLGSGAVQPVPFFIQWEPGSPHPSGDSPSGCTLESLLLEHEDPPRLNMVFEALGFDVDVSARSDARIVATLKCPKGPVDLS